MNHQEYNAITAMQKRGESGYRTFVDSLDNEWRWDGEKMQILDDHGWESSFFVSPEEILACMDVFETTPVEDAEELPRERDPMDVAHEYEEQRMIDEGEFDE